MVDCSVNIYTSFLSLVCTCIYKIVLVVLTRMSISFCKALSNYMYYII